MSDKKKIKSFDFVRAICAIGIIIYHFSCHSNCDIKILYRYPNGDWGMIIVALFFMISGSVIFHNYKVVRSLKYFYYKRWKSIFPMFYMVFIFVFILNVFKAHKLFYGPEPWKLVFSVFAFDGYLNLYQVQTYYILGEWFLGALVFVYFVYPLLSKIMNIHKYLFLVMLVCLVASYILMIYFDRTIVAKTYIGNSNQHLISCLLQFYLGVVFIKLFKYIKSNNYVLFGSLIILIPLLFIEVSLPKEFVSLIVAVCFFIVLFRLGNWIMNRKYLGIIFFKISAISLPIFYLQHIVILKVLEYTNPDNFMFSIIVLMFIVCYILILSKILHIVNKSLINCRAWRNFENKFNLVTDKTVL